MICAVFNYRSLLFELLLPFHSQCLHTILLPEGEHGNVLIVFNVRSHDKSRAFFLPITL